MIVGGQAGRGKPGNGKRSWRARVIAAAAAVAAITFTAGCAGLGGGAAGGQARRPRPSRTATATAAAASPGPATATRHRGRPAAPRPDKATPTPARPLRHHLHQQTRRPPSHPLRPPATRRQPVRRSAPGDVRQPDGPDDLGRAAPSASTPLAATGWVLPAGQSVTITTPNNLNTASGAAPAASSTAPAPGTARRATAAACSSARAGARSPRRSPRSTSTPGKRLDFYDVSMVDGANLPM